MEPVICDASSERMSPNMLEVTITSNCDGLRTSCMAALSTQHIRELHVRVLLRRRGAPSRATGGRIPARLPCRCCTTCRGASRARVERHAGDALDLRHGVRSPCRSASGAEFAFAPAALAEVDAAGQLADNHQVEPVADDVMRVSGHAARQRLDKASAGRRFV